MKDEAVPQALEGARVSELTRAGGDVVRMNRQMGWDGVGKPGRGR